MPEGDTLLRAARTLDRALRGKEIVRLASTLPALARARLAGRRVDAVEARGKNLVIRFDDGRALHTHLRMNGAWHLYRPGERWQRPAHLARVVLEVRGADPDGAFVAVCFQAPTVRLDREAAIDDALAPLGPDVLADDFDADEAIRRLRARADAAIGEALVDQRALAGVGNIYKSEALYARRIHPRTPVGALDDASLAALVAEARRMMRRNVAPRPGPRVTFTGRGGARYAVYRRAGEPCFACGAPIAVLRQGELRRSSYYCPACQPPPQGDREAPRAAP